MSDVDKLSEDPKGQFFHELKDTRTVMLGDASSDALLPMTPYVREKDGSIYFFTRTDTSIADANGEDARLVMISKGHDYHAYARGPLQRIRNNDIRDEFWSPTVAAWYDGKDDPALVMLQFRPQSADVWADTSNPLRFGFEIAKANMSKNDKPDVGGHAQVRF